MITRQRNADDPRKACGVAQLHGYLINNSSCKRSGIVMVLSGSQDAQAARESTYKNKHLTNADHLGVIPGSICPPWILFVLGTCPKQVA
jgi:hypothetical protein